MKTLRSGTSDADVELYQSVLLDAMQKKMFCAIKMSFILTWTLPCMSLDTRSI